MLKPARPFDAARAALTLITLALSCGREAPPPPQPVTPPAASSSPRALTPLPPLLEPRRGLGSMSARVPGTTEVVGGVRLASHHVTVTIQHGVAHTEIEEEFANDTDRVLEGRALLPVPASAALARLALWVGGTLVEGEVVERRRASRIFRGIVDDTVRPRDPALLDVVSGGELSLRVFPLPARGARRLVFAYDEVLRARRGATRYVLPLSRGAARATPVDSLRVTVNGKVWVDSRGALPTEDLVFSLDEPPPTLTVATDARGARTVLARSSAPPSPETLGSRDVVLALDTSEGQTGASLTAQLHVAAAVLEGLGPDESFALLACDTACAGYPREGLASGSRASIEEARAFLASLRPTGPSDPAGALLTAVRRLGPARSGQVVWMSDGVATAGELSVAAQLDHVGREAARADVRVLGVGRVVDHASLEALAEGLGATYDPVSDGSPLSARVRELALATRAPKVSAATAPLPRGVSDAEPSRSRMVRAGEEIVTLALSKDPVDGAVATGAPLARLWARERVASLEARGAEADAELVTLAVSHHLLSRATSLLVLENDRMFAEFGVARTRPPTAVPVEAAPPLEPSRPPGARAPSAPRLRMGASGVSGRVAPEIFQRVVRQSFGKLRACYETALRRRPTLAGRVSTRFMVGGDGAVVSTADAGSEIDDPEMLACVRAAFAAMTFPSPGGERVTVVYPITFAPAADDGARPEAAQRAPTRTPRRDHAALDDRPPRNSSLDPPAPEDPGAELARASHRAGDERWRELAAPRLDTLARAVERDPARRRAHLDLVRAALASGRFELAREAASRLVELDPELPEAREALAEALAALGRGVEASRATAMAASLDRRSSARQLNAARAALTLGDPTRACAHLRALGDLLPAEFGARAGTCRADGLAAVPAPKGGFTVTWTCDGPCAGAALLTPHGRVLSPWTSGGDGGRTLTAQLAAGTYRVVALDARPLSLEVRALGAVLRVAHAGGAATLTASEVWLPPRRAARW